MFKARQTTKSNSPGSKRCLAGLVSPASIITRVIIAIIADGG